MTWLPTYLSREHGMSLEQSGLFSFLPILVKGTLAPIVGSIALLMQRKGVRVIGMLLSSFVHSMVFLTFRS